MSCLLILFMSLEYMMEKKVNMDHQLAVSEETREAILSEKQTLQEYGQINDDEIRTMR